MEEWLHCSLASVLDGAEWSVHASVYISPGKHYLYSSNWRAGGAAESIEHFGKEKCSFTLPGIELRFQGFWENVSSYLLSDIQTVRNQEEVIGHGINETNPHWYQHNSRKYSSWNKSYVINVGTNLSFKLKS